MRIFVLVAMALVVMAAPALAQGRRPPNEGPKAEKKGPMVDEKAYRAALERIPEPKETYDPWGGARPAQPAKKPK